MTEQLRAKALVEEAEKNFGLKIRYDSNFIVMTRSPATGKRKNGSAEAEQELLEKISREIVTVGELLIGNARAARAEKHIGKNIFILELGRNGEPAVGRVTGVSSNTAGSVTASYSDTTRTRLDEIRVVERTRECNADEFLLVEVYADDAVKPRAWPWPGDERITPRLEFAESLGLRFEYDSGFMVVRWPASATTNAKLEDEAQTAIRRLLPRMGEISRMSAARARGARGSAFKGRRIFAPEFGVTGTLAECGADGVIAIDYFDAPLNSRLRCCIHEDVLLIFDFDPEPDSSSDASPGPERKNWLRRAIGV